MREISLESLKENVFSMIGKEWMLVTAGTTESFNMMTASWGGIGYLWDKPVAFVFVRPERHTYKFTEEQDRMTLGFMGDDKEMRKLYALLGTKSGRDIDKMHLAGLTPVASPGGSVMFEEARLTIEGHKLFVSDMREEEFLDKAILERWYYNYGGYHRTYVIEIERILVKE
ncbi:MAG: flavin reductase [Bacteroidaceae bacterium]|nr:flavin reductase [Bacteroidaceae bacterium]